MSEDLNKNVLIIVEDARSLILTRKELIEALVSGGCTVDVFSPYDEHCEVLKNMGCNVTDVVFNRRGTNPFSDLKLCLKYLKLIKKKYDFGITYSIKPNIYGGLAMRLKKIPYYLNVTGLGSAFNKGGILKTVIKMLYSLVSKKAAGIFFENSANGQVFVDMRLCKSSQVHVMHGAGINTSAYTLKPYPSEEKVNFLYIGRLMKEKGIEELYYSIKSLSEKDENVEFSFIGDFEDTYEQSFKKFLELPNVKYYGYVKDIKPYIEECHCLVLPSHHEGMANVLLEAAAIGRPLIASDIPGCREAVDNGKNGFVFTAQNAEELYKKIRHFIDLPYDQKKKMGEYSREYIAKNFERADVVKAVLKVTGF